jgi:hypothetical protein
MMVRRSGHLPTQSALGMAAELNGAAQGALIVNLGPRGQAFDTPTAHQALANHDVSARRAGRGWLIAEGGSADSAPRSSRLSRPTLDATAACQR